MLHSNMNFFLVIKKKGFGINKRNVNTYRLQVNTGSLYNNTLIMDLKRGYIAHL